MEIVALGTGKAVHPVAKPVEVGNGKALVICSVAGANAAQLAAALRAVDFTQVDLVEWRVDSLASFDNAIIQGVSRVVRRECPVPILATFRTISEGGTGDVSAYYRVLSTLLDVGVDALDVEASHPKASDLLAKATIRGVAVVLSKHNSAGTPRVEEMVEELRGLQVLVTSVVAETRLQLGADDPKQVGNGIVKYVVSAQDSMDALKLMLATRHFVDSLATVPVIALSMGVSGQVTRMFPSTSGSAATFVGLPGAYTAPGQVSFGAVAQLAAQVKAL
ncbi:putative 3-dehydroquinate dehydratase, type I [Gleimia coleocanis DSM 15436]|uniref:3-dehydroquinate dehydratase n=1 Tax=Gleimia coleocanis DSM 15436 TaxID=525245 RepID=C0W0B4_9ACTO|nr:type I 3-dehydroquinate dehydratase [Gleimia coleocanis]EEH63973.1 putative 3-dehydroquinate dehydratase, type I [Gleimia coleocanis DSM 15436]